MQSSHFTVVITLYGLYDVSRFTVLPYAIIHAT
jgi:hypothetical protein